MLIAGFMAMILPSAANAAVVYNLTFKDYGSTVEGTGVLTLNLAQVSDAYGLGYQSLAPLLVSIVTTDIHGHGAFNITPANLASGSAIQTAGTFDPPPGHIYTLTATQAGSGSSSVLFLDLYTNTWQIHSQNANGPTVDQGFLVVTGPSLLVVSSEVPLPAALPLFASGAGLAGFLLHRRRRRDLAPAGA